MNLQTDALPDANHIYLLSCEFPNSILLNAQDLLKKILFKSNTIVVMFATMKKKLKYE